MCNKLLMTMIILREENSCRECLVHEAIVEFVLLGSDGRFATECVRLGPPEQKLLLASPSGVDHSHSR